MVLLRTLVFLVAIFAVLAVVPMHAQQPSSTLAVFPERSAQEFHDPIGGITSLDLVRRALASNGDLASARLEVERARGRLRQAGLLPNPVVEFEHTTGRWTGSSDEKEVTIGVLVPVELGGKRGSRIDLAQADFAAAEADVANRERRLAAEVRSAFADAVSALRELEITAELNSLDQQTTQFVQIRVNEGDAPPLELNLLRAEADRLRSRRVLAQGRLESAVLRLKNLTGMSVTDVLRFREDLTSASLPDPPPLQTALDTALATRPDLRLARLNEEVAQAGLRLSRAQGYPDLTLSAKFGTSTAIFDQTPVGPLRDRDKLLTFGASISIPAFNRNQGITMEAEASLTQARRRREFVESLVRAEVAAAYGRYEAARAAAAIFGPGIIERSEQNVRAVRGAYEIGAFRISELLTEQRRLVDFQREYTEALAERFRALADLQAAMGTPVNP